MNVGVPQRSIPGRFLFSVLTNNVSNGVHSGKTILYGDDTRIVNSIKDITRVVNQTNHSAYSLDEYCCNEGVSIMPLKHYL